MTPAVWAARLPWSVVLLCDLDEWAAEQVVRVLAPMAYGFKEPDHLIALALLAVLTVVGTVVVGFATESQGWFLFGAIAFVFWATIFFIAALPALLFAGSAKAVLGVLFRETPVAAAVGEKKK